MLWTDNSSGRRSRAVGHVDNVEQKLAIGSQQVRESQPQLPKRYPQLALDVIT
jgi:hypothetical protein